MDSIQRELIKRRESLQKAVQAAETIMLHAPLGTLRIDSSKSQPRYFQVTEKNTNGKYLSKKEYDVAVLLAQKDYARRILTEPNGEIEKIDELLAYYSNRRAELIFPELNEVRKQMTTPLILDSDTSARNWLQQPYEHCSYKPEELTRGTRRGEMVRSKTEAFQANVYYELGIPYRYECALRLQSGMVFYPDFTLLDIANRRVIFHEHFGLLDDEDYRHKTMLKIDEYERNGIYVGKNLIITSESLEHPFNPERFRKRIKETFNL